MTSSLTIYSAICFTPFEESPHSTYRSYVDSQYIAAKNYVLLSLQLSRSFPSNSFYLVTNEPYLYLSIARRLNITPPALQYCPFLFRTDPGTPFRLAHFKIDVWNHIASHCPSSHACLLDLDIVGFHNSYHYLQLLINDNTDLFFYDQYSVQLRSYGENLITRDINLLSPTSAIKIWAGGEFLLGTKKSYAALYHASLKAKPNYIAQLSQFRHIGDETVLTAALISISDFLLVKPINQYQIINRLFLARLLKGSKRQSFNDAFGFSLLHLPSSKAFLTCPLFQFAPLPIRHFFLYVYMVFCIIVLRILPCR